MELWRLRYFVCVAEEEHLSRAAERLHVSQSPLSRQIRQLEEELGIELFYRKGRGIQLTAAGRIAYTLACGLLAEADRIEFGLRALGKREAGPVRVGYVQGATYNGALPETLARLRVLSPGIEPKLVSMRSQEQISAVLEREIEVGFVHSSVRNKNLAHRRLRSERFVMAIRADQAESITEVTVETLQSLHWIMLLRAASGTRTLLESAMAQLEFTPNVVLETTDIPAALSFVASGLGVALVQDSIAQNLPDGVVARVIPALDMRIDTVAIWHTEHIAPVTQRLLQALPPEV